MKHQDNLTVLKTPKRIAMEQQEQFQYGERLKIIKGGAYIADDSLPIKLKDKQDVICLTHNAEPGTVRVKTIIASRYDKERIVVVMANNLRKPLNRGFSAMDAEKRKAIAARGGKCAHEMGKAHQWTKEEATEAGRKGGIANKGKQRGSISATGRVKPKGYQKFNPEDHG